MNACCMAMLFPHKLGVFWNVIGELGMIFVLPRLCWLMAVDWVIRLLCYSSLALTYQDINTGSAALDHHDTNEQKLEHLELEC